jgi:serine/threonine protein kinase
LWCLLTGQPPFVADGEVALFDTVLTAPTPRLADAGVHEPALAALLSALLEKDPDARPANATVVADELQGWLAARSIPSSSTIAEAVVQLGLPSLAG